MKSVLFGVLFMWGIVALIAVGMAIVIFAIDQHPLVGIPIVITLAGGLVGLSMKDEFK